LRNLEQYANVKEYIETIDDLAEWRNPISDEEVATAYREISSSKKHVDKLMVSISSQKHIDHLMNNLKDELVRISEERKTISLQIMNVDKPLAGLSVALDNKTYLLEVFWKIVLLEYNAFSPKLKKLLSDKEFTNWNDARKKYALVYKIKHATLAFNGVFKVLTESFDQGLVNYRKAKRSNHRYKDVSAQRGLDAATMHEVEISVVANKCLGQFIKISDNLKDMDKYMKDTNKFYKENLKLATELYTNLQTGLREWGSIFKRMYK